MPEAKSIQLIMKEAMLVGLGAFIGANARYFITEYWLNRLDPAFYWGTLFVNVTGSIAIGIVYTLISGGLVKDGPYRFLIAIGFCGAYTTVSSYAWETMHLVRMGHFKLAVKNALLNNFLPFLGVLAGIALVRWIYSLTKKIGL